jgi:hypothetical protein
MYIFLASNFFLPLTAQLTLPATTVKVFGQALDRVIPPTSSPAEPHAEFSKKFNAINLTRSFSTRRQPPSYQIQYNSTQTSSTQSSAK